MQLQHPLIEIKFQQRKGVVKLFPTGIEYILNLTRDEGNEAIDLILQLSYSHYLQE
jgi:hypothetical protein